MVAIKISSGGSSEFFARGRTNGQHIIRSRVATYFLDRERGEGCIKDDGTQRCLFFFFLLTLFGL